MTTPTQVAHPWRAALRTAAQAATAVLGLLVVALPLVQEFVETVAPGSPVVGWIAATAGVVGAASLLVTRLMALPQVNALLTVFGLGAAPRGDE